jgi:hypothetical protein
MSTYSRMVLHFVHAVSNARGQGWARVHAFTFGTRLTNITRHLATRDVDAARARRCGCWIAHGKPRPADLVERSLGTIVARPPHGGR